MHKKKLRDGILFDAFLLIYFTFRFTIEFIRVEPKVFYGFSLYQVASVFVIFFIIGKIGYLKLKTK